MPVFNYRVMDCKGQYLEGTIEAENIKFAASRLKEQGLFIIKLDVIIKRLVLDDYFSFIKDIDFANLNKQLGVMLNAGITLVSALEVVEKQTDNPKIQKAVTGIKASLREGNSFYHSLKQYPKIFDSMMINMVQAGEEGGVLGNMLLRLSEHYEREHRVKEKVKAAMTYPAIVILVSIIAVVLMMTFILPVFTVMLGTMANELSMATKILISLSTIMRTYWYLGILIALCFLVSIFLYSRSATGKVLIDKVKIGFPILGNLHKKVIVARFCRTFGTLLGAGVHILSALEITSKTTDNSVFMEALGKCKDVVMNGKSMVKPLLDSGVFPYMVAHMAKVGEETGKLDTMFIEVGEYFQGEVDREMDNLSKIIEPIMIIFVGVLVGFLVLSMILPMFSVISSF